MKRWLYSEEAIQYRLLHGMPGESAEMAVGLIGMVPAVASGVTFSRDPAACDSEVVLIQAVHGLGVALVDGSTSPEAIHVSLVSEPPLVTRSPGSQTIRVVADPGAGIREEPLPPEDGKKPCISDEEAVQLARWAVLLEEHFGSPQDVEWGVTPERRLVLVQSRPLRLARQAVCAGEPVIGYPVLLSGGEVACPGAGHGPAIHLDDSGVPRSTLKGHFAHEIKLLQPKLDYVRSKGLSNDSSQDCIVNAIATKLIGIYDVSADVLTRRISKELEKGHLSIK